MSWILARKKKLFMQAAKPANVAFAGSGTSASGSSPRSFSSVPIGAAAADRHVIVAVSTNPGGTISTVSVAGTSCTQVVVQTNISRELSLWISNLPVVSGTTATISVSYTGSPTGICVATWAATGLQSTSASETPHVTTTNAASVSCNVTAGGFIIAAAFSVFGNGPPLFTWSGVSEDFDGLYASNYAVMSGGALNSGAGGSVSVSANASIANAFMMIAASFR